MLEYEILPKRSLVRVTYQFHPTYREWIKTMNAVFSDPNFAAGFNFLYDKRNAGEAASNEYVEQVSRYYRQHQDKMGRCAIVASNLLDFGMARMTEGYCLGDHVRAFMSIEEAERWLDTPEATGLAA